MVRATFNNRCQARIDNPRWISVPSNHIASSLSSLQNWRISGLSSQAFSLFCRLNWRSLAAITRCLTVALLSPSPTGHYQGNHNRCTPEQTLRYLNRLSGPFLDRFDLSLEIPLPPPGILSKTVVPGESSATVKQRVMAARERQFKRQNKLNAWLDSPEIRQFCKLESEDAMWLEGTLIHLGLSIRAWQRLLKVARTIADIDQSDIITRQHLQEAVSYRAIDRLLIHLQKLLT